MFYPLKGAFRNHSAAQCKTRHVNPNS